MSKNYTVNQLAEDWNIGLTKAYEIVNQPGFPSFRIGRKILIPIAEANDWQQKQIELYRQEKTRG